MSDIVIEERYKTDDNKNVHIGCSVCKKKIKGEPMRGGFFYENNIMIGVLFACSKECYEVIERKSYLIELL